uniref:Uncharacterized protein n=1 Tax=Plectus sambesii TaxID=2011161 RepID=A0A914X9V4_9BILA
RRVAQQKQRHSEDASSSLREDQAAGVDENANARSAVEKPPGFGDDDSSAAPPSFPPGVSTVNIVHSVTLGTAKKEVTLWPSDAMASYSMPVFVAGPNSCKQVPCTSA